MEKVDRNKSCIESLGRFEYDTKERLGLGAFAIVYKGWLKEDPNEEVAIKIVAKKNLIKSTHLLDKEIRILKELRELQHPNVVHLWECMDHPQSFHIVMEYCNGGDLQDYLNYQKTLSENTIRLFARQLAEGMRTYKTIDVVHRDLKPQNILLKFDNKYPCRDKAGQRLYPRPEEITLKIADFGFARFLSDGIMAATMCGSPMYMAPEVIMSMRYDAKADLWSVGTIIYQCLVGQAPFCATTPASLKQIYERSVNLLPNFPESTSPELKDMLSRLLKRNSNERISFIEFFNHPFLKNTTSPMRPKPLPSPPREIEKDIYIDMQEKKKPHGIYDITKCNQADTLYNKLSFNNCSSSETSDGFVLVPPNLPTDKQFRENNSSPPRPSTLPIQIPKSSSPKKVAELKSSPINLERKNSITTTVNSISPPAVQFVLGTPPLGRKPPDSPPGCNIFNAANNIINNNSNKNWAITPTSSPLRRSVVSSPLLSSPFTILNSNSFIPKSGFNARAITLPEIKNVGKAMELVYPELNEGKLFPREHTETLAKLNFVMALVDIILECANPSRERSERLVLLVRALQLLSCGLTLATSELKSGSLQPSKNVKNVMKSLNEKFHKCLEDCKKLNTPTVMEKVSATPEKILYNYAIEMCQKGALYELHNDFSESHKKYQMAQIILHSLVQQINNKQDKALLSKYQTAVEKRLSLLQDKQQMLTDGDYPFLFHEEDSNDSF